MGARYREYLQGNDAGREEVLTFKIVGLEETIAAFEQIRDEALKSKKVLMTTRRIVNKYYVPIARGVALTMGPKVRGNKFSESFGLLETYNRPYIHSTTDMITVRAGPRVHSRFKGKSFFPDIRSQRKRGGKSNYGGAGWLSHLWEYGTNDRTRKSGARTGRIKATKFATIAHERAKHVTERMLVVSLKRMMEREFNFASRGIRGKIKKA